MRCLSCDKNLSNTESTRKHAETGEYLDLCDVCLASVQEVVFIPTITNGVLDEEESEGEGHDSFE